ncbi:MAG: hypothetical protein HYW26_00100 [Candidatus Aenigmarchaeota archaeon]|nr:hypothetical protein [Candidatus Aenigmarchaeota archaeon]
MPRKYRKHSKGEKSHNVPSSRYILAASLLVAMAIFYSQINLSAATGFASYSVVKVDTDKGTYFALQPQEEKAALQEEAAIPITGMQTAGKFYLCGYVRDSKRFDCLESCNDESQYAKGGPYAKAECEKAKTDASKASSPAPPPAAAPTSQKLKCTDTDQYGRKGECRFLGFGREGLDREGCSWWESCIRVGSAPKCSGQPLNGRCTRIKNTVLGASGCDQLGGTVFQGTVSECKLEEECCINIGGKKEPAEPSVLNARQKAEAEARTKQRESEAAAKKPTITTAKPPATKAPARPVTTVTKPVAVSQNVFACSAYDEASLTEKIYCRQKCGDSSGELPYDTGFDVLKAEGYAGSTALSQCQAALNKYKDTLKPGDVLGSVPTEEVLRERTRASARSRPIASIDTGTVQLVADGKTYDRFAVIVKYGEAAAEQKYKLCALDEPDSGEYAEVCVTECDPSRTLSSYSTKEECEAKKSGAATTAAAKRTYCAQLKGECISSSSEAYKNCVISKGWLRSSSSSRESQSCTTAGEGDTCCLTWGAKRESLGDKGTSAKPEEPKTAESVTSFPYGRQACVKERGFLDSGAKCCDANDAGKKLVSKNSYCVVEEGTPAAQKTTSAQETSQLCKDNSGRYQCYPSGARSDCLSTLYADRECTVAAAQSKTGTTAGACSCEYDMGADAYVYRGLGCSRTLETCTPAATRTRTIAEIERELPSDTLAAGPGFEPAGATAGENAFYGCAVTDVGSDTGYSYWCVDSESTGDCIGSYETFEGEDAETQCWVWADDATSNLLAQTSSSSSGGGGYWDDFVPAGCVEDYMDVDPYTQQCCSGEQPVQDYYGYYYCPSSGGGSGTGGEDKFTQVSCVDQYYSISEGQACCSGAEPTEDEWGQYCP